MAMESNHACGEWALCPSMLRSSPILLTTAPQPEWKGGSAPAPSRRRANCSCLADSPLKPPNLPRAPLAPRHLPPALPSYPLSPQCLSSNTSPPRPNPSGSPNTGFRGARPFLGVSLGTCGRVSFKTECQTAFLPRELWSPRGGECPVRGRQPGTASAGAHVWRARVNSDGGRRHSPSALMAWSFHPQGPERTDQKHLAMQESCETASTPSPGQTHS